jgi:hypothetical protein
MKPLLLIVSTLIAATRAEASDWRYCLAAAALLHADHLRAEFRKQCRAIGPRDIPPEIEHPHPLQNSTHRPILFFKQCSFDRRERSIEFN